MPDARSSQSSSRVETDAYHLKPCNNPRCDRKTTKGVEFCCFGCANAHAGGYEIHDDGDERFAHSAGCDDRHVARGGTR